MANNRLRGNFLSGTLTDNPLLVGAIAMNSAGLATIPPVANGDYLPITLDPAGSFGSPEIIWVTAHTAAATSATIARAKEGTGARQHAQGVLWIQAPTTQDYRGINNDRVWNRATTANALDDEFNDATLDSAWVRYDVAASGAGPVVYTEGADVLNVNHAGASTDNSGPAHCLLKPLGGLTYPVTIEMAFRVMTKVVTNYTMFGPIMTDGVVLGSKAVWANPYWATTYAGAPTSVRTTTFAALNGSETASYGSLAYQFMGAPIHVRLRWSAANTFQTEYSIDGVGWFRFPTADVTAFTMTPTQVGFAISSWGTAAFGMASVDYFRVS